ncbi:hypothetical protein C9374_011156 [Naegleria lovaniensis]|uniref:Uncharacterized protein n=1 Tax=Naegleria lovaniensis TaxID=51637 RepID=A0AA88KIL9_NAELO|nr:uncharacterized protein C9374_011156 [Naegleria lovaniensis]KAG2374077.1 hypothetical protein C9374_011156 [Naegleria lovaniensis]
MNTTHPSQSCQNINNNFEADNTITTTYPCSTQHVDSSSNRPTRTPNSMKNDILMNFAIFENIGIVILTAGLFVKAPSTFTLYPLFDSSGDVMDASKSNYYRYVEMSFLDYCQQCKEENMLVFMVICVVVGVTSMCLALCNIIHYLRVCKLKSSNNHTMQHVDSQQHDISQEHFDMHSLKKGYCLKHVITIVGFSLLSFTSFALLVYMQYFVASMNSKMTMEQCYHVEWYARTSKILSLVLGSTMNVIGIGCLLRLVVCSFWKKKPAVDHDNLTCSSSCHAQKQELETMIALEKV